MRELTDRPFGVDLILPAQTTSGDILPPRPPSQRPTMDPAELEKDVNLGEFAVSRDGTLVQPRPGRRAGISARKRQRCGIE